MENLIPDLPSNIKNIGMKLSGGADSAVVCYALSKYIYDNKTNQKIIPITVNQKGKAYQSEYAKKIVTFCEEKFGSIFGEHYIDTCEDETFYSDVQDALVKKLYNTKVIACHFTGITANPPKEVYESFNRRAPDDRDQNVIRPLKRNNAYRPLTNFNKQKVKQIYEQYDLLDTLFPLTRSCEKYTDDFNQHCGKCWHCQERYWGFGRYF